MQDVSYDCNTLQHTATHCNTLQHDATHCYTLQHTATSRHLRCKMYLMTATHCNTLQHTATHCDTLQHAATCCNTLQYTATSRHLRCKMHKRQAKGTNSQNVNYYLNLRLSLLHNVAIELAFYNLNRRDTARSSFAGSYSLITSQLTAQSCHTADI